MAATPEALYAQRDAATGDACVPMARLADGGTDFHPLEDGTALHVVPCRATFADVISVVILERDGVLRTLHFPDPGMRMGSRWQDARMDRIGVTTWLSSPTMHDDGSLVSRQRIAPGMGDGDIVQRYRIEDGSPVLSHFTIERVSEPAITLWSLP